ncbi:phage tail protein [Rhodovulum sulfidophilum]|uniref:phage tail protein n=1 Tax=Rhodovulum sulfidophilum TaxID=35806 RepID=UPI000952BC9B|nr:phage tail protein [Rhodovulum sulfidophilum]OLS42856.1 hypothetical protein BV392_19605 [Rhodovulum sulfidophilum]
MPENATAARPEPLRNYQFSLQIQNREIAAFTACTNLGMRIAPIRYREGGAHEAVRWLTGDTEYGEVCLRFGVTNSTELWDWIMTAAAGAVERRNVAIILYTPRGNEALRYNLTAAWPCEWAGAHLDALDQGVAYEYVKLVFEQIAAVPRAAAAT